MKLIDSGKSQITHLLFFTAIRILNVTSNIDSESFDKAFFKPAIDLPFESYDGIIFQIDSVGFVTDFDVMVQQLNF